MVFTSNLASLFADFARFSSLFNRYGAGSAPFPFVLFLPALRKPLKNDRNRHGVDGSKHARGVKILD